MNLPIPSFVSSWWPTVRRVGMWGALAFMLFTIVRTALAEPSTTPREADRQAADRVIEQENGAELRMTRPDGSWVGGLGVIEPATPERQLAPASAGRIVDVHVAEGDQVTGGTVLVQLEDAVERAALAVAAADVVRTELDLQRVQGAVRREDVAALRRDAEAAGIRAEQSQSTYDRLLQTRGSGGVSDEELDRARRQAEQDRLAADASVSRQRSAEQGRPLDVRVAQANHDAAVARRDQAQAQLQLKQVVAPTDGEILELLFEVGEYVTPNGAEPVAVMGDTRTLRARIDVDERDIDAIVPGGRALITVDAMPNARFEGQIVQVARRMGRKNVRSDEPTERVDTKILEVVVDLGPIDDLIVGQRVMGYLERKD